LKAKERDAKIAELEERIEKLEGTLGDLSILLAFLCKTQEAITDSLESVQSRLNQKNQGIFITKKVDDLLN